MERLISFFTALVLFVAVMFLTLFPVQGYCYTAPIIVGQYSPRNGPADAYQATQVMTNYTGASGKDRAVVVDVHGWRKVAIQGTGHAAPFGTYTGANPSAVSGTFKVLAGPGSTGPFAPVIPPSGSAASWTTDFCITLDNASNYIEIIWTKTKGAVDAWVTPGAVR